MSTVADALAFVELALLLPFCCDVVVVVVVLARLAGGSSWTCDGLRSGRARLAGDICGCGLDAGDRPF